MSKKGTEKKSTFRLAVRIFFRGLGKSLLIVMSIVLVGVVSYFGTRYYYKTHADALLDNADTLSDIIEEATVDDISKNLIYVWDKDKEKLPYYVLEIFNTKTGQMNYVTIPGQTQITVSVDLYQRLSTVEPEVPQIIKLSKLHDYFDGDETYEYGVILLEDYFKIDISYYTVVERNIFKQCFQTPKKKVSYKRKVENPVTPTPGIDGTVPDNTTEKVTSVIRVAQLRSEFLEEAARYAASEKEFSEFLQERYKQVRSNLDIVGKVKYVKSYLALSADSIFYDCIPGEKVGKNYEPALAKCKKLFASLDTDAADATKAPVTEIEEDKPTPAPSSAGRNIVILNATGISGLAAQYQQKFQADGFTILQIGNYTEGTLESTKITVREDGMGQDLAAYFKNAIIETGVLPQGVDIQIAIGREDQTIE